MQNFDCSNLKESMSKEQKDYFWSKVDIQSISSCWEWLGAKKPKGYGNVRINKKYLLSHRVAWELTNFPIPQGYLICHSCDNPKCCNPNHLMIGTPMSNVVDMIRKGRHEFKKNKAYGINNPRAKLTWEQVSEIRMLYTNKFKKIRELAELFNVTPTNIRSIINFKTRKES